MVTMPRHPARDHAHAVPPNQAATSDHERMIGALTHPRWLVEGRLTDDRWRICAGRATAKRRAISLVPFDVVIAPGGGRLTDPEHESDLITAKIILYQALRPLEHGGLTSSNSLTQAIVREYCTFVRWRLSRGIPSNRQLTADWLDEYLNLLREVGPRGVLPLASRWAAYLNELSKSGRGLPARIHNGKRQLAINTIAHQLGLETALGLSPDVRRNILEAARAAGISTNCTTNRGGHRQPGRRNVGTLLGEKTAWTASRLNLTLRPIELLYRFRSSLIHDPLGFDPFPQHRTMAAVARSMSRADSGARTPTAPAFQTCYLVDQALTWVFVYGEQILSFAAALAAKPRRGGRLDADHRARRTRTLARSPSYAVEASSASPWPVREGVARSGDSLARPPFREVLFDLLPGACMIVIAAFSARRLEEIDSLRTGCIITDERDHFLETWISKTLRRHEKIPVPSSVARAVSVLERLSETRRMRTQDPWIFAFDDPIPGPSRRFDPRRALARFTEHVNVPALPSGERWWFTPHQFRRFFGVVYYHHYRFPHLAALSRFYRHFDPDMTRRYVTEKALGGFLEEAETGATADGTALRRARRDDRERLSMFQEAGLGFRVERYTAIALGEERASGFGGELLTRELDELVRTASAQVEIGPSGEPQTLDQLIIAFASERKLEPHPQGHSYCKCSNDLGDLAAAGCLRERAAKLPNVIHTSTPDPAFASDQTCSRCPHNVQLAENEDYWRNRVEHEAEQVRCAIGPLYRALALGRLAMAEQHCRRCFGGQ